jgi:hypothetical protein
MRMGLFTFPPSAKQMILAVGLNDIWNFLQMMLLIAALLGCFVLFSPHRQAILHTTI